MNKETKNEHENENMTMSTLIIFWEVGQNNS